MKALLLATALLIPTLALAQSAESQAPAPAAPSAAPAPARPIHPVKPVVRAPVHAAKPAAAGPEVLEIIQIQALRQVDPATYEIDALLANGRELHLRANAFVLQSLGAQLGTYGH